MLLLIVLIVSISRKLKRYKFHEYESEQKAAGRIGEETVTKLIKSVMNEKDLLFTNVEISFDGKKAELDNIIINPFGIFIIETKNYVGEIEGKEDDYIWIKTKTTHAGNVYQKSVLNPIKQVKRQIYLLVNYIEYFTGIRIWIKGYAYLINNNSPIENEFIIQNVQNIDKAIHKKTKTHLNKTQISKIKDLLSE